MRTLCENLAAKGITEVRFPGINLDPKSYKFWDDYIFSSTFSKKQTLEDLVNTDTYCSGVARSCVIRDEFESILVWINKTHRSQKDVTFPILSVISLGRH